MTPNIPTRKFYTIPFYTVFLLLLVMSLSTILIIIRLILNLLGTRTSLRGLTHTQLSTMTRNTSIGELKHYANLEMD
jgi:hypothetical protein